ncbi:unnamed protein product [Pseudo-nitzschia multistriata]|uniref:Uncharacterized protein n=1 Tax=Pseudo-nitzschia multistriata TaxID=183589 RepID=A0A448ZNW7_9STRA|nr:unnamed protein product [Pseudo-nitzschia multistriata]
MSRQSILEATTETISNAMDATTGDGTEAPVEKEQCPVDSFDYLNPEFLAVCLASLTVVGSIVTFFMQRARDRVEEKEAERKAEDELDRQQALERVRTQLSTYVGPLHRLYKTQNTILMQYRKENEMHNNHLFRAMHHKGSFYWSQCFHPETLQAFLEDPFSPGARAYRNMVVRRLKPVYTRIRELVLNHAGDLADMPTQGEWLRKYDRESVLSPFTNSIHANVIFDTYTAWTFEFDDIIESWTTDEDFSLVQPTTRVAWLICNDLVDLLYENAKDKEAKYNKHVKVHKNIVHEQETSLRESGNLATTLPAVLSQVGIKARQ